MTAVEEAAVTLGTAPACRASGVPRASLYRERRPVAVVRPRPVPPRALDSVERQAVLDLLHTRFVDQAPAQMHAALLDEGTYLCSPRTMYRVLETAHEIKERRDQVRRPHYAAPELLATRPNEVWSWDITKLLGPTKWTYFYLYVILDIFSRYVVGWMLAPRESAALAERLIAETCAKHDIQPGQPDAEQAGGLAVGRSRRHENTQPTARLQRQSVFRSPVQDAQILSAISRTLRIDRRRPGVRPIVLSLVQPRASSQRPRVPAAGGRPLRPGRGGARAPWSGADRRVRGAPRTLRQRTAATSRSADGRLDQPASLTIADISGLPKVNGRPVTRLGVRDLNLPDSAHYA